MLTLTDKKNIKNLIRYLDSKQNHRLTLLRLITAEYHNKSRDDLIFIKSNFKINDNVMKTVGKEYNIKYVGFDYNQKAEVFKYKYLFKIHPYYHYEFSNIYNQYYVYEDGKIIFDCKNKSKIIEFSEYNKITIHSKPAWVVI